MSFSVWENDMWHLLLCWFFYSMFLVFMTSQSSVQLGWDRTTDLLIHRPPHSLWATVAQRQLFVKSNSYFHCYMRELNELSLFIGALPMLNLFCASTFVSLCVSTLKLEKRTFTKENFIILLTNENVLSLLSVVPLASFSFSSDYRMVQTGWDVELFADCP